MIKNIAKIFLICLLFVTTGCGFKVLNELEDNNFTINDIQTTGDKRINYILKNKLATNSNKNEGQLIQLELKTNKLKTIKEKNISNQVTKYEINIETLVKYTIVDKGLNNKFKVSKNGFYDVSTRYSQTLTTERNLVNLLTKDLSKEIIDQLSNKLNDL